MIGLVAVFCVATAGLLICCGVTFALSMTPALVAGGLPEPIASLVAGGSPPSRLVPGVLPLAPRLGVSDQELRLMAAAPDTLDPAGNCCMTA